MLIFIAPSPNFGEEAELLLYVKALCQTHVNRYLQNFS